jgi:hypothetical protein
MDKDPLPTREEFDQVKRLMADRAPNRTPLNTHSDYLLAGSIFCAHCGAPFIGQHTDHGRYRYYQCQSKNKLGAKGCAAKQLRKEETGAAVIDLLRRDVRSPRYLRELRDLVNAEADTASHAALAEAEAVAAQLAEARKKLDNLYRAIEDGGLDLSILAPRIREVKTRVDELDARRALLPTASTPVVRLADEATIARYVERLHAVLATGTPAAQRTFLRTWIARIEADGMKLTVTFTLPGDLPGMPANNGKFGAATESLPPVANGDPNATIFELGRRGGERGEEAGRSGERLVSGQNGGSSLSSKRSRGRGGSCIASLAAARSQAWSGCTVPSPAFRHGMRSTWIAA